MTMASSDIQVLLVRRRQHGIRLWHEPDTRKITIGQSAFMSKVFNE